MLEIHYKTVSFIKKITDSKLKGLVYCKISETNNP